MSPGQRTYDKEDWWWNEEVQEIIQRKRLVRRKWDIDRTEESRQEYVEMQRKAKKEFKRTAHDKLYKRSDTKEGKKEDLFGWEGCASGLDD